MKAKLNGLIAVGLLWASAGTLAAASYTVTNAPGWNLIANQLNAANGNRIGNVIPSPPLNSRVQKYSLAKKAFETVEVYTATAGWFPGTNILNPGEGLMFSNASASTVVLTFNGNPVNPILPLNIGNSTVLVARQTNATADFAAITGYQPKFGTVLYRFNPGAGRNPNIFAPPHYTIHAYNGTAWSPSTPVMRVGESVWIATNGAPPTITSQPVDRYECPSGRTSFSVTATGLPPLSYQWYFRGSAVANGTNASLTVPVVSNSTTGQYQVVVSNPVGSTTSSVAVLYMTSVPILSGPVDTAGCAGTTVTLAVSASGAGPFSYSWYKNGQLLAGVGGSSINIGPMSLSTTGRYCVVVTGECGSSTNCANVTLRTLHTVSVGPNRTNCVGTSATFAATVTGQGPFTYQWLFNNSPIPGRTNATLAINPVTTASMGSYCVAVTGPCGTVTSCAYLFVNTPLVAVGPFNTTNCLGSGAVLGTTVTGSGPFTYRWFKNGTLMPNYTGPSIGFTGLLPSDAGTYCVEVTGPCNRVTNCAVLAIGDVQPPQLFCPSRITTRCVGAKGTPVNFQIGVEDNCDGKPTVVADPPSGSLFFPGITTVTVTATDASGNKSTCTFDVEITAQPPDLICPPNRQVVATGPDGAIVNFDVQVSDDCHTNVQVDAKPPSGSLFPIGSTIVTVTAINESDQVATCTFTITVVPGACCDNKNWVWLWQETPSPRMAHSMATDSRRNRVVLFGGLTSQFFGDTWEWNGSNWVQRAESGPEARAYTAMAYLPEYGVTILFGGYSAKGVESDTWAWDGNRWQPLEVSGPPGRIGHAMAYDETRKRIVMFGGVDANAATLNDTWEFDGKEWTSPGDKIPNPGPLAGHMMAWDGRQVILFGGSFGTNNNATTWGWAGDRWLLLAEDGPSARRFSGMAYDVDCARVVLFGGGTSSQTLMGDTWEWAGESWTYRATNNPVARWGTAAAYDPNRREVIITGGARVASTTTPYMNDTWGWATDTSYARIRSVRVTCGDNRVVIVYDRPILPSSATNPANYQVTIEGKPVDIVEVLQSDDLKAVALILKDPVPAGASGLVNVFNVRDICGGYLEGTEHQFGCTPDPCVGGNTGTEFWLTFPGNYSPDQTRFVRPRLFITGDFGTFGTVSMPGLPTPWATNFTIGGNGVAIVLLPRAADLDNANNVIEKKGIHVTSSRKVSVYGHNYLKYTTDSYLGIPTSTLGKGYMLMTYQNVFTGVPELNGVQFAVVGTVDNTTVVIKPSAPVAGYPANVPFLITLNRGETFQLRNTSDSPADLTGTVIVGDQPIAVFGSHQCANIPNENVFFCDYLVEQMFPLEWSGTSFLAMPLRNRTKADTYRFMAIYDGTTVSTNGVAISGTLNKGRFFEVQIRVGAHITANKPILAAQFANSSDYDMVEYSDPFMALIPPIALHGSDYLVETPPTGYVSNFINVVGPPLLATTLDLDGVSVPPASFSPIGASGYVGARLPVGTGPHTLTTGGREVRFGVLVYGWNQYDSYGYPGGLCGNGQTPNPPRFSCPPSTLTAVVGADCTAPVPDVTSMVGNAAEALLIVQSPEAGTLLPAGNYEITVSILDGFGNRTTCRSTLIVSLGQFPGLVCPQDIVTNAVTAEGTIVHYQVRICDTNYTVVSEPPSGSLFPVGTTTVNVTATDLAGRKLTCSFNVTVEQKQLALSVATKRATLNWEGNAILQKATTVLGPWVTIPDAEPPYDIQAQDKQAFFRVLRVAP